MTNYSAYLKLKTESDKNLAKVLDRSVKAVGQTIYEMATDTLAGSERASWYLSCLVPGHSETCRELAIEDYRWLKSRVEILNRNDIILDMVELYFKRKISKINQPVERSFYLEIGEYLSGLAADEASGTLSKNTLTYFLALAVLSSSEFKDAYAKAIIKSSGTIVSLSSFYGKVQIAALAARRLKSTHPEYYWDLHRNNIEMVYHIIEESMKKILYLVDSGSNDEDNILYLVSELMRKK